MESGAEHRHRVHIARFGWVRRDAFATLVASILLIVAAGCGRERGGRTSADKGAEGGRASATDQAQAPKQASPAPGSYRVVLTDKECVAFDPHWITIPAGQSVTWQSRLARKVTIHVAAGAFDRSEFVVPAGGSVTSGPARGPGSFPITTDPTACRGIPRGAEGPAPGLTVEGAAGR
jgi:plastocyanin